MEGEQGGRHSRLAARYLRREFQLKKPVKRATAYVAAVGHYELFINGQRIGNEVLTPIPSDYRKTIYYNTYDVSHVLGQDEPIAIGIVLGNGRGFNMRQDKPYKNTTFGLPKCRLNVIVEYEDGTTERLVTDEKWCVTVNGPIRANNEYDGEVYDARMELDGDKWTMPGYDESQWLQAETPGNPFRRCSPEQAAAGSRKRRQP